MRRIVILTALLLLGWGRLAEAQKKKGKCTGEPVDSALFAGGPVYRDCEVDRPAKLWDTPSRISFTPSGSGMRRISCLRAEFQLVVDAQGKPEPASVVARPGNDRDLDEAVRPTIADLRWEPAQLDGVAVRQVAMYRVRLNCR